MESGGMYASSMGSGMLGLEMSLNPQIPQQRPQHHMVSYDQHPQVQQSVGQQGYQQFPAKPKNQNLTLSDDDEVEVGNLTAADNSAVVDDGKRQISPWHRMKWTDNMVRLLIMVVYYIGDEGGGGGGSEGNGIGNGNDMSGKKKGGGGGGGGVLQKKGKWKSVSKAMMERGFFVSPQQCEDKFNDLNKRYKRVNDILGKGIACKVVENQALLDSMHHLSAKLKEEVKKLLNSKHLFFREMCAYHNSCNHGGSGGGGGSSSTANGGGAGARNSPEVIVEPPQPQQQTCLHSNGSKVMKDQASSEDGHHNEDNDYDEDNEEDEDVVENGGRTYDHDDDNNNDDRKRQRKGVQVSPLIQQLGSELINVVEDGTKSPSQKRVWMRTKMMQLEEERVSYQAQAFELEKQRLKWEKFSSKKEREMARERLENERMRLENERMVLLIRRKELELLDLH